MPVTRWRAPGRWSASPGSLLVLLLFVLFAWRGYKIAERAGDGFGRLLAAGLHLPGLQGDDTRRPAPEDEPRVALHCVVCGAIDRPYVVDATQDGEDAHQCLRCVREAARFLLRQTFHRNHAS